MSISQSFLPDRESSYRNAMREQIRAAVESEYAERFADCTIWKFVKLKLSMSREIRRRLKQAVSPTSLYGKHS